VNDSRGARGRISQACHAKVSFSLNEEVVASGFNTAQHELSRDVRNCGTSHCLVYGLTFGDKGNLRRGDWLPGICSTHNASYNSTAVRNQRPHKRRQGLESQYNDCQKQDTVHGCYFMSRALSDMLSS
jgi:hypothetical protein